MWGAEITDLWSNYLNVVTVNTLFYIDRPYDILKGYYHMHRITDDVSPYIKTYLLQNHILKYNFNDWGFLRLLLLHI